MTGPGHKLRAVGALGLLPLLLAAGDGACLLCTREGMQLAALADRSTPLSIGSDSQVIRNWPEELRWLEYGQRLHLRQRNVAAAPPQALSSRTKRQGNTQGNCIKFLRAREGWRGRNQRTRRIFCGCKCRP